jgi:glycosyltransferase involved in cell wall biosynthesis
MRIAFEASALDGTNPTGTSTFLVELLRGLARIDTTNDYMLLSSGGPAKDPFTGGQLVVEQANFRQRRLGIPPSLLWRGWHHLQLPPIELLVGPVDVLHCPSYVAPASLPRCATVATIHDLVSFKLPETLPPRDRAWNQRAIRLLVDRADHLLADSESTRTDLIEVLGLPPERITTVHLAARSHLSPAPHPNDASLRAGYGIQGAYFLYVGAIQPRKNVGRIVEAFRRLRGTLPTPVKLVLAGGWGWLSDEVLAQLEHDTGSDILNLGRVPDAHLGALYRGALGLVYPSLYEGFGLPVLEAMACGCPAIASNVSSLPEVAGSAGLLVSPTDTDAIEAAMRSLATDEQLRADLASRSVLQASTFSWQRAARETLGVYQGLTNRRSRAA